MASLGNALLTYATQEYSNHAHDAQLALRSSPPDTSDATARVIYATLSLLSMLLLSIMLGTYSSLLDDRRSLTGSGTRLHLLCTRKQLHELTFVRMLNFLLYLIGIAFIVIAAILESGLDLHTLPSCRAAIYVCLFFYVGSKICVQLFLIERVHVIRSKL